MNREQELERRVAELEAREQDIARREKIMEARSVRHCIYDGLNVSLRTVDTVIVLCAIAIVALVVLGRG